MMTTEKTKWSYLAGIIDGEGCISISRKWLDARKYNLRRWATSNANPYQQYSMRVTITNTDRKLMTWLIENFGGVYYLKREATEKHKASHEWRPKGQHNTEILLLGILPYLIIKHEQAEVALQYVRLTIDGEKNPPKREELFQRMALLNKKGNRPETNTSDDPQNGLKIESDLTRNCESAPVVTQVA